MVRSRSVRSNTRSGLFATRSHKKGGRGSSPSNEDKTHNLETPGLAFALESGAAFDLPIIKKTRYCRTISGARNFSTTAVIIDRRSMIQSNADTKEDTKEKLITRGRGRTCDLVLRRHAL